MNNKLLEIKNLKASINEKLIINNLSLAINKIGIFENNIRQLIYFELQPIGF
jgi:hypothetical protein